MPAPCERVCPGPAYTFLRSPWVGARKEAQAKPSWSIPGTPRARPKAQSEIDICSCVGRRQSVRRRCRSTSQTFHAGPAFPQGAAPMGERVPVPGRRGKTVLQLLASGAGGRECVGWAAGAGGGGALGRAGSHGGSSSGCGLWPLVLLGSLNSPLPKTGASGWPLLWARGWRKPRPLPLFEGPVSKWAVCPFGLLLLPGPGREPKAVAAPQRQGRLPPAPSSTSTGPPLSLRQAVPQPAGAQAPQDPGHSRIPHEPPRQTHSKTRALLRGFRSRSASGQARGRNPPAGTLPGLMSLLGSEHSSGAPVGPSGLLVFHLAQPVPHRLHLQVTRAQNTLEHSYTPPHRHTGTQGHGTKATTRGNTRRRRTCLGQPPGARGQEAEKPAL